MTHLTFAERIRLQGGPSPMNEVVGDAFQKRRRILGIRMDGRYCLACGGPLFGPEMLHTLPRKHTLLDAIRWAGEQNRREVA